MTFVLAAMLTQAAALLVRLFSASRPSLSPSASRIASVGYVLACLFLVYRAWCDRDVVLMAGETLAVFAYAFLCRRPVPDNEPGDVS